MNLRDRFTEDMKQAMKAQDKVQLATIRLARAAILNVEKEKHSQMNDDEVVILISKEIKQRKDAIEAVEGSERHEYITKMQQEIEILSHYLPTQLSADELHSIVAQVVAEVGAQGPKDMGKVMSALMPKVKGKADGKLVNQIVKEHIDKQNLA